MTDQWAHGPEHILTSIVMSMPNAQASHTERLSHAPDTRRKPSTHLQHAILKRKQEIAMTARLAAGLAPLPTPSAMCTRSARVSPMALQRAESVIKLQP